MVNHLEYMSVILLCKLNSAPGQTIISYHATKWLICFLEEWGLSTGLFLAG